MQILEIDELLILSERTLLYIIGKIMAYQLLLFVEKIIFLDYFIQIFYFEFFI